MAELGSVAWPPAPIRTERLVLRPSEPRDRAIVIELHASPDVYAYLGGPQPRDHLEKVVPETPGQRPGFFAVELEGAMVGEVSFSRRDADRRGHLGPAANEVEVSYLALLTYPWRVEGV
jgi:RimJ/RimL family protein N-acetyltransferase